MCADIAAHDRPHHTSRVVFNEQHLVADISSSMSPRCSQHRYSPHWVKSMALLVMGKEPLVAGSILRIMMLEAPEGVELVDETNRSLEWCVFAGWLWAVPKVSHLTLTWCSIDTCCRYPPPSAFCGFLIMFVRVRACVCVRTCVCVRACVCFCGDDSI
jgi:hypothetical protein